MNQDISAFIVKTSGTVGGRARINGTRIAVRTIVGWYKQGITPKKLSEQYEHLTLAQIYAALAYYHANREEIETDIQTEEALYDQFSAETLCSEKNTS